ncbi:MAG: AAAP aminoacid transporter 5 [Monoraphidium minutum]|nr:MAG: AAAP aminoacid transporter 5 [Monoraphidium minutum]
MARDPAPGGGAQEVEGSADADAGADAAGAASASPADADAITPGYYNPRPLSPLPARVFIRPESPAEDGTPRVSARVDVQDTGGASSMSSVATLLNSAVGAGVLSLPYAFACAGLLGGIVLCLVVAGAESFSLYVLSKFAERYDAHSYGSLVRKALGRKLSSVLSLVALLYLFGSCIAYLVIIGDTFSSLAAQAFGASTLTGRHAIILAVGIIAILPMCFAPSLSALEWVSAGAVVGFLYTSTAVLWRGSQIVLSREDPWAGVLLWQPDLRQALYAVSILVFGFNSSANTITIFSELDNFPHRLVVLLPPSPTSYASLPNRFAPRPSTYKLIGMIGIIIVSMCLLAAGYTVVGAAGYAAFRAAVNSNVLNNFPADDPVIQVARATIGVMVTGHYPLNFSPARLAFCDLMATVFNVNEVPRWGVVTFTLFFVGTTLGTALVVTNLGSVLHLIGGTAACFMVFGIPGLLAWNAAVIKATASTADLSSLAGGESGDGSRPLIPKKAGLRSEGPLLLAGSKTWAAGLGLIVIALLVFAVTLLTAGGGAGH